jgi:hypothetical protein
MQAFIFKTFYQLFKEFFSFACIPSSIFSSILKFESSSFSSEILENFFHLKRTQHPEVPTTFKPFQSSLITEVIK